ncbi:MAG: PBP1A family penicillin-binding protein, partial [bacterium]|nr:PBP1A family penicillin-binding protein [bacterium]
VVPMAEIPDSLKQAVLVAEDNNFYNQPAFDWQGIVRAIIANLKSGQLNQGGSTITQQLAKNLFLSPEKTFTRKIKELVLAIELESQYSKEEIFELYLNQIPFGSNAYGAEAASQTYFNKPVKELSIAESAILAALIKAPSYYSPWGSHQKELLERQQYVLNRMKEFDYITDEELVKTEQETKKIDYAPPTSGGTIKAPHFVFMVKDYLVSKYGEAAVEKGGLRVVSTLNWELQEIAEKTVKNGVERNTELYNGSNGALVAQDADSGQIIALVGSKDYFDSTNDGNFNVAAQGLRQPGSALKPFAYMTGFQEGYSPKTVLFDVETEFDSSGNASYKPQNFDGLFRGPITLEQALAQSINVPAVKILYLVGIDNVLENLHNFGISTLRERSRYGLSLVLGGGEVKLVDLVEAYSVFSQDGVKNEQKIILEIKDNEGKILEKFEKEGKEVIEKQPIRLTNQILSDERLRSSLFQQSLNLTIFPGYEIALKTGTTNDYRDAWAIGYTPNLVVGIWAGNNNNEPMTQKGGSILAAIPMWHEFTQEALKKYEPKFFPKPELIAKTNKPMINGEIIYQATINDVVKPQIHSILFYVDKKDPLGSFPTNPYQDPQFENWEKGIIKWSSINFPNFINYNQLLPIGFNPNQENEIVVDENLKNNDIIINFSQPRSGEFISPPFSVKAEIQSRQKLDSLELYVNQMLFDRKKITGTYYHYDYPIFSANSQNFIELKVYDERGSYNKKSLIVFK